MEILNVPRVSSADYFPRFFLPGVLEKQYEELLRVIDKAPPHEDLTFVDSAVNLQEGLEDHNEDAG